MSVLQLNKMTIENFKGIKYFELLLSPTVTAIKGANGSGKTSIADAFYWCLFGKSARGDASGSDNFREKPLDADGREKHHLTTSVKLDCQLDGEAFEIVREQNEKWAREKGSATERLQGNTTTYYINGVELKLREFNSAISRICADDVFRYVATLSAFNGTEWKKRRNILLSMVGGVQSDTLLESPKYKSIKSELENRHISFDALCKAIRDDIRRYKTDLDAYPVRIDEAKKAAPMHTETEVADARYAVEDALKDIERINGYIAEANSDTGVQKDAMIAERNSLRAKIEAEHSANVRGALREFEEHEHILKGLEAKFDVYKMRVDIAKQALETATNDVRTLRKQFCDVRDAVMPDASEVCPACGQKMPPEFVAKAVEAYKTDKQTKLQEIRENGIKANEKVNECSATLNEHEKALMLCAEEVNTAKTVLADKEKAYKTAIASEPDYNVPRLVELEHLIAECPAGDPEALAKKIDGYNRRKHELEQKIESARMILVENEISKNTQARVDTLMAEMSEAGVKLSEVESLSMLIDDYITARCNLLESDIDAHFDGIHWKLFEKALNGNITECCSCMIKCDDSMIAYESANTASRINADIGIVKALSKHYDVRLPLFIDNAESVLNIADAGTQMITLTVSDIDTLTAERMD